MAELPTPDGDPGATREVLEDVLARPEFGEERRPLLQRATEWVFERIGEAFDALLGNGGGGALGWLLVALLALAAVVFAVRFTSGTRRDPGLVAAGPGRAARRTAADWRSDAETHERDGEWRGALRCRWRALVADLATRGLVEEVPGRTAGEYRQAVAAAAPAAAPPFDGATSLFEAAWYGGRDTGPEESERFRELADRVLASR